MCVIAIINESCSEVFQPAYKGAGKVCAAGGLLIVCSRKCIRGALMHVRI